MPKEKLKPKNDKDSNKDASVQPDPETLNTTDPQENMKGPVSSIMHKIEENMDNNEKENKKEE
jgi:hypothetical protein